MNTDKQYTMTISYLSLFYNYTYNRLIVAMVMLATILLIYLIYCTMLSLPRQLLKGLFGIKLQKILQLGDSVHVAGI